MTTEALFSELVQAGVLLKRTEDGRLMADDTPGLAPFVPIIQQQKEALLEIVAKRDATFALWIREACTLNLRVSTGLHHLWFSCEGYGEEHGFPLVRADFDRLMRTEFEVNKGMAVGLSLKTDWQGYKPYKLTGPEHKEKFIQ